MTLSNRVIVPNVISGPEFPTLLRDLLDESGVKLGTLAEELNVRPSHVSAWLRHKEGRTTIPIYALERLCELVGRKLLIALVKPSITSGMAELKADNKNEVIRSRELFIGMSYLNRSDGPNGMARLLASLTGACSWSMYMESQDRNILEWIESSEGISNPELMHGLSYASELPIEVIQSHYANISGGDRRTLQTDSFHHRGNAGMSSFARREQIQSYIALGICEESVPTVVCFLNFRSSQDAQAVSDTFLSLAKSHFGLSVREVFRRQSRKETMQRGELKIIPILDMLECVFQQPMPCSAVPENARNRLAEICRSLWPGQRELCTVYALDERIKCSSAPSGDLVFVEGGDSRQPDDMVLRAARDGETFYVEDLSAHDVRDRLDPRDRIPTHQWQKLVTPLKCDAFLDCPYEPVKAAWKSECESHIVLQHKAASREFKMSWGALSIDPIGRGVLSHDKSRELAVLCHLVANCQYVAERASTAEAGPRNFFRGILDATLNTIAGIRRLEAAHQERGRRASAQDREYTHGEPLEPLCAAVVRGQLIRGAERFDVYPYDYVHETFRDGASYVSEEWRAELKATGRDVLVQDTRVGYLRPRKGGNSERLLGVLDEIHIIRDAQNHPRVSPITKLMGNQALIGCSCRVGTSLKPDAVMWIGWREPCEEELDLVRNQELAARIRVLANIAAVFCVTIRWWGYGSDWPSPTESMGR